MIHRKFLQFVLCISLSLFSAIIADAQATRTWVSGVGDDVNPCSRTAPCKTFAGAISKTATNGEINCLDPAGYGAVTITKSITIDCRDTQGSILSAGTNGVIVNVTSNANTKKAVKLRGISINGAGTGINGIRLLAAKTLNVEDVVIDGTTLHGISVEGSSQVAVNNSTIRSNISVGLPIDLAWYPRDALRMGVQKRIGEGDPYFSMIRQTWGSGMRQLFGELPNPDWLA